MRLRVPLPYPGGIYALLYIPWVVYMHPVHTLGGTVASLPWWYSSLPAVVGMYSPLSHGGYTSVLLSWWVY